MKLFLYYLKDRLGLLLFLLLSMALLGVVFSLYNLPIEPVLYSGVLIALSGLVIMTADFVRYRKRHLYMQQLQNVQLLNNSPWPGARSLPEADYAALLQTMMQENKALISRQDMEKEHTVDYYTLWAHQIKTPLAAMTLLLAAQPEGEEKTLMKEELLKTEQYVDMVLSYLRLDSSTNDLLIQSYSLDEIVRSAVHKYAGMFVRKKISLCYEPLNQTVLTDKKWLAFVIEQLLSNALKYTSAGKVSIYMDPSHSRTLIIEDTGMGIAPEDLPRVFEKGYTGYNGRNNKKSTGIGLYLVQRTLQMLSHTISITSQPGQGTKVCIDLSQMLLQTD